MTAISGNPVTLATHPGVDRALVSGRFLTASNILSLLRLVLAVPFAWVMLSGIPDARIWGGILLGIGLLTDKFDGVLARKYGQISEWGRILDPLADKVGIAVLAIVLLIERDIPLWFVVTLLARDVLISLGGLIVKARRGIVLPSNLAGKWALVVISLTMILGLLRIRGAVLTLSLLASVIMIAVSLALYVRRFTEIMKSRPA